LPVRFAFALKYDFNSLKRKRADNTNRIISPSEFKNYSENDFLTII